MDIVPNGVVIFLVYFMESIFYIVMCLPHIIVFIKYYVKRKIQRDYIYIQLSGVMEIFVSYKLNEQTLIDNHYFLWQWKKLSA